MFASSELAYASPITPTTTNPLHRTRRTALCASDSSPLPSTHGFIQADLRAGGPRLTSAPAEIHPLTSSHPRYNELAIYGGQYITDLNEIAEEEGLDTGKIEFVERVPVFEALMPVVTLIIWSQVDKAKKEKEEKEGEGEEEEEKEEEEKKEGKDEEKEERKSWIDIARRMHAYLTSKGVYEIQVEILDEKFQEQYHGYALQKTDALNLVWAEVLGAILGEIRDIGVTDWLNIGFQRLGSSEVEDECPVTLILRVEGQGRRDWRVVREKIIGVLDGYGLSDVAVWIYKDRFRGSACFLGRSSL